MAAISRQQSVTQYASRAPLLAWCPPPRPCPARQARRSWTKLRRGPSEPCHDRPSPGSRTLALSRARKLKRSVSCGASTAAGRLQRIVSAPAVNLGAIAGTLNQRGGSDRDRRGGG